MKPAITLWKIVPSYKPWLTRFSKLPDVIGLSVRSSIVMFPTLVSIRTLVASTYGSGVGEVPGGVGVGLEGSFPWLPKNAKAPTEIITMAIMATAANNVLIDFLRLTGGLLFLLG